MAREYRYVELSEVTDEQMTKVVNTYVHQGWQYDGVQFAMHEHSKRPAMAFFLFTRGISEDDQGDSEELNVSVNQDQKFLNKISLFAENNESSAADQNVNRENSEEIKENQNVFCDQVKESLSGSSLIEPLEIGEGEYSETLEVEDVEEYPIYHPSTKDD